MVSRARAVPHGVAAACRAFFASASPCAGSPPEPCAAAEEVGIFAMAVLSRRW